MSKSKRLRKRFAAFVYQLTPDQVREQLILAYLQMEKCQNVLNGYDVEPVEMMDNGDSSDLELFYRCKKASEELAYLNQLVHDGKKVGTIELEVKLDTRELQNELVKLREYLKPNSFDLDAILRLKAELSNNSESLEESEKVRESPEESERSGNLFAKGQEVWYMFGDRVQHSTIEYPMHDVDGITIYRTKLGHNTAECETFCSLEELLENLKKTVNE